MKPYIDQYGNYIDPEVSGRFPNVGEDTRSFDGQGKMVVSIPGTGRSDRGYQGDAKEN